MEEPWLVTPNSTNATLGPQGSTYTEPGISHAEHPFTLPRDLYETVLTSIAYVTFIAGVPGTLANIFIIITYAKMGITNSINASYTAMAVSDLGCVLTTIWFIYLTIPHVQRSELLPIVELELLAPTAAYPNMAFAKTTSFITAYISIERCLCVASPHKVKLLFTKRFTVIVLIFIYIVCGVPPSLVATYYRFEWKPSEHVPNKTVLGTARLITPQILIVIDFIYYLYGIAFQWAPLLVTVVCSIFLAVYLNAGAKWRKKSTYDTKSPAEDTKTDKRDLKEDRIIKMVLLIAILSIVLSTPVSLNFVLVLINPDFIPYLGAKRSVGDVLAAYATSLTMINSCFNILVYYKLGTRFRSTFRQLFRCAK